MKNALCHSRLRAGISNLNNGRCPTVIPDLFRDGHDRHCFNSSNY